MSAAAFIARRIADARSGRLASLIIRLAIVSTALCVAVMIIASALLRGFKSEISEKIFGFWGHIHVAAAQSGDGMFEAVPFSREEAWIDSLRAMAGPVDYSETVLRIGEQDGFGGSLTGGQTSSYGGVRHVQSYIVKPGVIHTKEEIEGILLKGAGEDFDWEFFSANLRDGEVFSLTDPTPSRMVLLSVQTAARVDLSVGEPFLVHFPEGRQMRKLRFTVGGLYRTGLEEYDTQFAIVDQRVLQDILGWRPDQISGVEIVLADARDAEPMAHQVYIEEVPAEFYAESVRQRFPGIFEWLDLQDLNEYVIIGLMVIVCVINMITALLILILERTEMIGVLRTLGMGGAALRGIFLRFAAKVLARGLLWGNAVGLLICLVQATTGVFKLSEENYYLSTAPIAVNWWMVLALNLGTFLLVMVALVLPAMLVTRVDPVKTLRFD